MPRRYRSAVVAAVISVALAVGLFVTGGGRDAAAQEMVAAGQRPTDSQLRITYPLEKTLFPPESVAPTFVWEDKTENADHWTVVVRDDTGHSVLQDVVEGAPRWR